jgi:hypothetical protein
LEGLVGVALIGFVPVFFVGRAAYYCTDGRCRDGNEIRWRDFQLSGTVCMYNDYTCPFVRAGPAWHDLGRAGHGPIQFRAVLARGLNGWPKHGTKELEMGSKELEMGCVCSPRSAHRAGLARSTIHRNHRNSETITDFHRNSHTHMEIHRNSHSSQNNPETITDHKSLCKQYILMEL